MLGKALMTHIFDDFRNGRESKQVGLFAIKCIFVCDDYELHISSSKMVFKDGYIYGLQILKEASGNPLGLVRFTLETN